MFKTLTLPVSTLVALASIKDDTLRAGLIEALETGTADPDSFDPAAYRDADPLIRDIARRIGRRAARARRHSRQKAIRDKEKKERQASSTPPAQPAADPTALGVDNPLIVSTRPHEVTVPVNDRVTRRFLWFNHNFENFVLNTLGTLKSVEGYGELYEPLAESFDYITRQITRLLTPIARQVSDVMRMPRHSRPAVLTFLQGDPRKFG